MNAYELADALAVESSQMEYGYVVSDWELLDNSANMLRQQADRIAELEKKLQESALDYISVCSQADEHYARLQELEKDGKVCATCGGLVYDPVLKQTKPLSDEEICKLFNEHTGLGVNQKEALQADLIVFARAIEERHGIK